MEPVNLTVSNIQPDTSTSSIFLNDWMKAVEERSGGKITFDYYGAGTLLPSSEALSALKSNRTQMTSSASAQWDNKVFQDAVRQFGYPGQHGGIPARLGHYGEGSAGAEELAKHNMVPLLPMTSGPAVLHGAEPFDSPEDLSVRHVRVPNDVSQRE